MFYPIAAEMPDATAPWPLVIRPVSNYHNNKMSLRRNILLFHSGALGDFVLTFPLLMALSRIYPHSRVLCVTHPSKGKLAEKLLGVESVSLELGWHHLLDKSDRQPEAAKKYVQNSHMLISFISTPDDDWSNAVKDLNPQAELHCIDPIPKADYDGHFTQWVIDNLPKVLAEATRQMVLSIRDRGLGKPRGSAKEALIHPGSGSVAKCWPIERYIELAHQLASQGMNVRFILGEVERERWPASRIGALERVAESVSPEDYVQLADLLLKARLYIGNDSGPTHLASVLGLNVLALFGASNPVVWSPIGPRTRILQAPAIDQIEVPNALKEIHDNFLSPQ